MCVKPGFWNKSIIENALEKAIQVLNKKTSGSSIGYKKWRSKPMANTTRNGNNHRNDSKMCKTKPVLNEAWAELRGGWVQLRRGKNPRQGESTDKTKTKQTVQLRTSNVQKTRKQAGRFQFKQIHSKGRAAFSFIHISPCPTSFHPLPFGLKLAAVGCRVSGGDGFAVDKECRTGYCQTSVRGRNVWIAGACGNFF